LSSGTKQLKKPHIWDESKESGSATYWKILTKEQAGKKQKRKDHRKAEGTGNLSTDHYTQGGSNENRLI
jgi:hypothetical protein